jgi:mono/diheme cytochrome c family protein
MASLGTMMRVVTVSALLLVARPASAQDDDSPVARGRRVFETHGCYGCHAIGRVGATTAPSLSRVGAKYSLDYLTRWLRDTPPRGSVEHMPKIQLTEPELRALAAYLSSLREF